MEAAHARESLSRIPCAEDLSRRASRVGLFRAGSVVEVFFSARQVYSRLPTARQSFRGALFAAVFSRRPIRGSPCMTPEYRMCGMRRTKNGHLSMITHQIRKMRCLVCISMRKSVLIYQFLPIIEAERLIKRIFLGILIYSNEYKCIYLSMIAHQIHIISCLVCNQ